MKESKNTGYDTAVGPCRACMRLFGSWPDPHNDIDWFSCIRALFVTMILIYFGTFAQTAKQLQVWGDLNTMTEIFVSSEVTTFTTALKIFSIWYYRKALQSILLETFNDWQTHHTIEEWTIMETNAKYSKFVSATCIFLANATFVAQAGIAFLQIIKFGQSVGNHNETLDWPLYVKAHFTYNAQISPYYEITLIGQMLSNAFAATAYTAIDSLFVILVLHLCGQLSVLKSKIIYLKTGIEHHKDFDREIAFFQQRHDQLIRYNNVIEEIFNKTFLIQVVTSSLVLCMLGYQLITLFKENTVTFIELLFWIYYILCFLFITFVYCFMGEKLRENSFGIADAVYECNWLQLPFKQSKKLIMIMIRANQPFKITAGKLFTFTLEFYCSILKSSGGYVSMLLAVQKRIDDSN